MVITYFYIFIYLEWLSVFSKTKIQGIRSTTKMCFRVVVSDFHGNQFLFIWQPSTFWYLLNEIIIILTGLHLITSYYLDQIMAFVVLSLYNKLSFE